ncbi:hypothetical protein BGX31_003570 [Mortierella sp. GBA43]|nr:hypothetical protein BGX31_003570 [Mortierella sp. GBA43]
MYASGACERVLQVDPDEITGKPILLYLRADDLAPFVEQVDFIKASTAIAQMRFCYEMKSDSPQSISRSVLDRIRILDLDDEGRSRPLMELPENDPCLVFESTAVTEVPAFKEVIVQRYTESDDEDNDDDVECLGLRDMDIDDNSESGFRR